MANLKKIQMSTVKDNIINMEFDSNPNIPTANYCEKTSNKIQEVIMKKMRAEKLKKMLEAELKQTTKVTTGESIGLSFSFKSM